MRKAGTFLLLAIALAGGPARAEENLVEPLSNGMKLSMTMEELQKALGPPVEIRWGGKTLAYKDFIVYCGGPKDDIWRISLTGPVKLSSGIGPGSPRADVKRVFGSEITAVKGQYQLVFNYDPAGTVTEIVIQPANGGFVAADATPPPAIPNLPALVGKWLGNNDHELDLFPDGTYKYGLLATGSWHVDKDQVVFDGALAAWNGGRGNKDGRLEFVLKDDTGERTVPFVKQ